MKNYDNQDVEIIPGFKYKVAPKDRGLKRLFRRTRQFSGIMFGKTFSDYDSAVEETIERYSSDDEIEFYRKFGKTGLLDEEKYIIEQISRRISGGKNCLVVGCGTGREVFGVEKFGFSAIGIDNCKRMVEEALVLKKDLSSQADFEHCDFLEYKSDCSFDVVFLTYALLNHIQGKVNRVAFLKKAKSLIKKNGYIVMHCDEFPVTQSLRYHVASTLLRVRWFGKKKWQRGDTARSFLGTHTSEEKPLFFHYYTSHYEVLEELEAAGLFGWQFRRGWLIMDSKNVDLPIC